MLGITGCKPLLRADKPVLGLCVGRSPVTTQKPRRRIYTMSATQPAARDATGTSEAAQGNTQRMMNFLREDLTHLFDDQGIDQSAYDNKVNFQDPITRYSSVQGYVFNIKMLRRVFDPKFLLHDLKQTGPNEITTRWTMNMILAINKYSPLRRWWDPQLVFTGTSIMAINEETGRFNSHIDTWDAIQNQKYLSLEAVRHLLSQLVSFKAPQSKAVKYTVLKKLSGYEVRRYEPIVVAQCVSNMQQSATTTDPAATGQGSAQHSQASRQNQIKTPVVPDQTSVDALKGYAAGRNSRQQKLAAGLPILSDSSGTVQLVLECNSQDPTSLPLPEDDQVQCATFPGGVYAVKWFSGEPTQQIMSEQMQGLQQLIARDALSAADSNYVLAQHHGLSAKAYVSQYELLRQLDHFDVWGQA